MPARLSCPTRTSTSSARCAGVAAQPAPSWSSNATTRPRSSAASGAGSAAGPSTRTAFREIIPRRWAAGTTTARCFRLGDWVENAAAVSIPPRCPSRSVFQACRHQLPSARCTLYPGHRAFPTYRNRAWLIAPSTSLIRVERAQVANSWSVFKRGPCSWRQAGPTPNSRPLQNWRNRGCPCSIHLLQSAIEHELAPAKIASIAKPEVDMILSHLDDKRT